jgi:hypothetical protein
VVVELGFIDIKGQYNLSPVALGHQCVCCAPQFIPLSLTVPLVRFRNLHTRCSKEHVLLVSKDFTVKVQLQ